MTDWIAASLAWQKQVLHAQRAALTAGQRAVAAGDTLVQMQDAGRKAAAANLAAWQAWASLWGVGR